MSDSVIVGLIVASSTLIGSVVTGIFAIKISKKKNELELIKKKLKTSLFDNLTFYELERKYTEEIARLDKSKSSESIKKKFRKELREKSKLFLSKHSTSNEISKELKKL